MITDLARGTAYLAKGVHIIKQPKIRRYVIVPLLLNIILFSALISVGFNQFSPLVDSVMSYVPDFLSALRWVLWIIITLLTAVTVFFLFTPLANIVAAPFNAIMSEKIEEQLTGKEVNGNLSMTNVMINAITSQIRKLWYIALWGIALLLVSLIPLINFLAPFLWVLFGSWLLTLEYMDFPMGNHDLTFNQQKQTLKQKRGISLGFGLGTLVITSIPFVNFFAIPIAVAGATALYIDEFSDDNELSAQTNASNTSIAVKENSNNMPV